MTVRTLGAAGLALGVAMLAGRTATAGSPRLLVFLHVAVKQRALQGLLQSKLSGTTVTAVGRIADFDRALQEGQDAVLSLPVVLAAKGLTIKLQGQRGGAGDETYALVGADRAPDPARVASIGALDLLGREGTTSFVHGLLGSGPKVERVTKVEDLLPLLQMQRVEGIILPTRLFSEIRSMSRLNLVHRELGKRVGLPALAAVGPEAPALIGALSKLPGDGNRAVGVESWR